MWTILLLVLFFTLPALLFVPADVSLKMERKGILSVELGFRWLFVRLRRELTGTRAKAKGNRDRPKRQRFPIRTLLEVGKVPGLAAAIRRLVVRLASSVRILEVTGRMRLGTGDPADTGVLWGLAFPLVFSCNRCFRTDVAIEPDFSGPCLTGSLGGTVRLYPARFVYGIGSTVFSVTTIRVAWAVLRTRPWKH